MRSRLAVLVAVALVCFAASPALAQEARVMLPLPRPGPYEIVLHLIDLQPPGAPPNRLDISVRGRIVSTVTLGPTERNRKAQFAIGRALLGRLFTTLNLRATEGAPHEASGSSSSRFGLCSVEIAHLSTPAPPG